MRPRRTTAAAAALVLTALWSGSPTALGQGTVTVNNRVAGLVVAPVYACDADCMPRTGNTGNGYPPGTQVYAGELLAGAGYTAQLWYAPGGGVPEESLVPAAQTTGFLTGAAAGYLVPLTLSLPGIPGGTEATATFQLRVWDNVGGTVTSWEQALALPGVARGASPVFTQTALFGGGPLVPAILSGLRSFSICSSACPPTILAQPQSIVSLTGGTAWFTVGAGGTPPLAYNWKFNGTDLADGGRLSGTKSSFLTITAVEASDLGQYSVTVSNPFGIVTSSPAALSFAPLRFLGISILGGNAILSFPSGSGATYEIQASPNVTGPFSLVTLLAGTGGNLQVPVLMLPAASAAYYRFAATTPAGTLYSENLVGYAQYVAIIGTNTIYNPFVNLRLQDAFPNPPPGTQIALFSGSGSSVYVFSDLVGWGANGTVVLPPGRNFLLLPPQTYGFTLAGEVYQSPPTQPPTIVSQPADVTVIAGQPASFVAGVAGSEPLTYRWYFNSAPLSDGGRITGAGTTNLTIAAAEPADDGLYYLVAQNPVGSATSTVARLVVRPETLVVYQTDFEQPVGNEWSAQNLGTTPAGGRRFLGEFGNQAVTLSLSNLPPHLSAELSLDFFAIRSWDGSQYTDPYSGNTVGPDVWEATADGALVLVRSTFSNVGFDPYAYPQSYPDAYPGALFPGGLGATEVGRLGYIVTYSQTGPKPADSVYRVVRSFTHDQPTLTFSFQGIGLQGLGDESWGLDNVRVTLRSSPTGALAFAVSGASVLESAGSLAVNVRRIGGTSGTVSVNYSTMPGAAAAGTDYVPASGTLTFAAGETNKTIVVPILDDLLPEGGEVFFLSLTDPAGGAVLGTPASIPVQILDDECTLRLDPVNVLLAECSLGVTIPIFRVGSTNNAVSVQFATAPVSATPENDYFSASGTVTIPAGATRADLFINLNDDQAVEADEQFTVTLSNPSPGAQLDTQSSALVTILDNDSAAGPGRGINWQARAMAAQPDGKLLIGGDFTQVNGVNRMHIARLNPDGSLDLGFNPGAGPNNAVETIVLQPDGKILIGGSFTTVNGVTRNRIARLHVNGSLDSGFAAATGANGEVHRIALQPDGKVIIAGGFGLVGGVTRNRIARLNTNGTLDTTFNPNGGANGFIYGLGLQPDGRIVISGPFSQVNGVSLTRLARLHPDGSLDASFIVGSGMNARANAIVPLPDGKLLLGGLFTTINGVTVNRLARLHPNGAVDGSFSTGTGPDANINAVVPLPEGKILVAGSWGVWDGAISGRLVRLTPGGSVDPTFAIGPGANAAVTAAELLPDGRVAAAGDFSLFNGHNRCRFALLNADGSQPPEPLTWVQWGQPGQPAHWYALNALPGAWSQAELDARSYGGHLVTINSAEEQAFLEASFSKGLNRLRPLWIGFNDAATEGLFQWSSGEPVTYSKWSGGEPNDFDTGEDYATINWHYSDKRGIYPSIFGMWNDLPDAGATSSSQAAGPHFGIIELPTFDSPQIVSQPRDLSVAAGATAIFSVEATGLAPLSYQWRYNGEDLPGATQSVLALPAVQSGQAGVYSVLVSNPLGSLLSSNAGLEILQVSAPPPLSFFSFDGTGDDALGTSAPAFLINAVFTNRALYLNGKYLPDDPSGYTATVAIGGFNYDTFTVGLDFLPTSSAAQKSHILTGGPGYRWLSFRTVSGKLELSLNNHGSQYVFEDAPVEVGRWHRLVCSVNVPQRKIVTFLDGRRLQDTDLPPDFRFDVVGTSSEEGDKAFTFTDYSTGNVFEGLVANLAVFGQALSPAEITTVASAPPLIYAQPQGQFIRIGGEANFKVVASGGMPLGFQWLRDGAAMPGATGASLRLEPVRLEDGGFYQVRIDNSFGSTLSDPAPLFLLGDPPVFVLEPVSQIVGAGSNVTFVVEATGTPAPVYQWLFNGTVLPGATSPTLIVPNAQLGNGGIYRAIARNFFGETLSEPASLAVYTRPVISRGPASLQVAVGASATFSVVALSSGPLSYQWFFDGAPIPGATGATFTIGRAELSDTGTYSVEASGLGGSVTSGGAALVVVRPPDDLVPRLSYTVPVFPGLNLIANQLNRGGNTLLEIMPSVPPGTVVWKYNNAAESWIRSAFNATLGAWVPANIVLKPGEGAFIESLSRFDLTFTGTANTPVLPVTIPEGAIHLLSRQTNAPGTYENIVGREPAPGTQVFRWISSNAAYIVYNYNVDGWQDGVAPLAAIGEAVWIAPNGGQPPGLPSAPQILGQPASVDTVRGEAVSFSVEATGSQPLSYQWRLNGNNIPGATGSSYAVAGVTPGDAGDYTVVVANAIGIVDSAVATLTVQDIPVWPFANNFADAGSIGPAPSGVGTGNNRNADRELLEPHPLGVPRGASVWLQWVAAFNGRVTFSTAGSGFDTLLAVYTGDALESLALVAVDDDSAPFLCSTVEFDVVEGQTYRIQVDGYYGVNGRIILSWNLVPVVYQPPVILAQPQGQTVIAGSNAVLAVVVENPDAIAYQWYRDGLALPGATSDSFGILGMTPADAGLYQVAVSNTVTRAGLLSRPADVQFILPGDGQRGNPTDIAARDKLSAATDLTPPDPNFKDPAPVGSFTATQTFSTKDATSDPGEPSHCGYPACGSYWCSYQAPATGLLTIDTIGTSFNAVLAVYTGPGTSYSTLVPVACSANHGAAGESVTFAATAGTQYWVVVQGVNCARGSVTVHYTLSAAPNFTSLPLSQTVGFGARVTLSATVVGGPPLGYQWQFNGANLPGATDATLVLPSFAPEQQGGYSIVATNIHGTNISAAATVLLSDPPRFVSAGLSGNSFTMQFIGQANASYVLESSPDLRQWSPVRTNSSPIGIVNFTDPSTGGNKFYRARKQ